ncbi:MAG: cupin domain-containing protein [Magnetococcales bacterium]|nr:cupin domain-containing protein [Magnetococcales bacterium]
MHTSGSTLIRGNGKAGKGGLIPCAGVVLMLGWTLFAPFGTVRAEGPYQKVQPLLTTSQTVLNEPLILPDGSPMTITSTIVTIDPGEETAWHKHGVPLYAFILSGEVTIDYGDQGTRTFRSGSAFMEAMNHWHRGTNPGKEPVRILAIYMGSNNGNTVIQKQ